MPNTRVRHTRPEDIPALIKLQARVYPAIPPWSRRKLGEQLDVFPQGQLVAENEDGLIGCASSLIVLWDDWADSHTWKEITGAGTFENHTPTGKTLTPSAKTSTPTPSKSQKPNNRGADCPPLH